MEDIIYCPGSRNAPISLAFKRSGLFNMRGISDERSAAFVALGIAQNTKNPVAVLTTSGSAVANLFPAITEAFFRGIPLVVITADRPSWEAGNWTGQTIFQPGIFGKHVEEEYSFGPESYKDQNSNPSIKDLPECPVHINISFEEPFYPEPEFEYKIDGELVSKKQPAPLKESEIPDLGDDKRIMILLGQGERDPDLDPILEKIISDKKAVVLRDVCSNQSFQKGMISNFDLFKIDTLPKPDLVLSFGKSLVSKKLKTFLSKGDFKQIHFGQEKISDPFRSSPINLSHYSKEELNDQVLKSGNKEFGKSFLQEEEAIEARFDEIDQKVLTELLAYKTLIAKIPENSVVHLANSMAVRYAGFFQKTLSKHKVECNRGTSGIDGCLSTAVGSAITDPGQGHFLFIGDQAFFYDMNILWSGLLPDNLSVFLFNNAGGGIFELIKGPAAQPEFEELFYLKQKRNAEGISKELGIEYERINSPEDLFNLGNFATRTNICEIFTDRGENLRTFEKLKKA